MASMFYLGDPGARHVSGTEKILGAPGAFARTHDTVPGTGLAPAEKWLLTF
jgi:hypothetical protein